MWSLDQINLYKSLFRGRDDVFAIRFEKGGKSGFMPAYNFDRYHFKLHNVEKTLVDCFKFRNKIGVDVFLEVLKFYKSRKRIRVQQVIEFARICKVDAAMRPYI